MCTGTAIHVMDRWPPHGGIRIWWSTTMITVSTSVPQATGGPLDVKRIWRFRRAEMVGMIIIRNLCSLIKAGRIRAVQYWVHADKSLDPPSSAWTLCRLPSSIMSERPMRWTCGVGHGAEMAPPNKTETCQVDTVVIWRSAPSQTIQQKDVLSLIAYSL
jgi:hypothetical protein